MNFRNGKYALFLIFTCVFVQAGYAWGKVEEGIRIIGKVKSVEEAGHLLAVKITGKAFYASKGSGRVFQNLQPSADFAVTVDRFGKFETMQPRLQTDSGKYSAVYSELPYNDLITLLEALKTSGGDLEIQIPPTKSEPAMPALFSEKHTIYLTDGMIFDRTELDAKIVLPNQKKS